MPDSAARPPREGGGTVRARWWIKAVLVERGVKVSELRPIFRGRSPWRPRGGATEGKDKDPRSTRTNEELQGRRAVGMTKKIYEKVMLVGRATTFTVGLAVILALSVGLASTALAGTGVGARFQLGQTNIVNAITKLVGSVVGPSR